jgi:hypothetical protein
MNCILKDRKLADLSSTKMTPSLQTKTHSTTSIRSSTIQWTNIPHKSANYQADKPNRIPF